MANVDFALQAGRAVSGTAVNSPGRPLANESLYLAEETISSVSGVHSGVIKRFGGVSTAADGSFRFKNVPTGSYKIKLSVRPQDAVPAEAAAVPITVTDASIDGVLVATSPGEEVRGTVETDRWRTAAVQLGTDPYGCSIERLERRSAQDSRRQRRDHQRVEVHDQGRVRSGRDSTDATTGRVVLSRVYTHGRDITDSPVDPREVSEGVRVVLTDKATRVSGTVVDQRGQPIDDFVVMVFPADERLWGDQKFFRVARADQDRRFAIINLPPADYHLIALEHAEPDQVLDREFLKEVRGSATALSLSENEKKTLELKISVSR